MIITKVTSEQMIAYFKKNPNLKIKIHYPHATDLVFQSPNVYPATFFSPFHQHFVPLWDVDMSEKKITIGKLDFAKHWDSCSLQPHHESELFSQLCVKMDL